MVMLTSGFTSQAIVTQASDEHVEQKQKRKSPAHLADEPGFVEHCL
jgi:hypothetical protein